MEIASPYDAVCVETALLRLVAVLVLQEHGARGVDGLPESQEKKLFEDAVHALAAKRT